MTERLVKIMPNGDAFFLHADDMQQLVSGDLTIKRASDVRFNEEEQVWQVFMKDGDSDKFDSPTQLKSANRKEAIQFEVEMLERMMADGEIDFNKIFPVEDEEEAGVKAIIFLQDLVGIDEPEDKARRNWKGFKDWEKKSTLKTYRMMGAAK